MLGRHFKIKTDHQSLKFLLQQRISIPNQQKWLVKLIRHDFDVVYEKGRKNVVVNALSKRLNLAAIFTVKSDI